MPFVDSLNKMHCNFLFENLFILNIYFFRRSYTKGTKVKILINDLELSDRFLGSSQDMTLLEADVTLIGLYSSPVPLASPSTTGSKFSTFTLEKL